MKIARKILKRQSNMDKKMLQREVIKFLQPVRKSGREYDEFEQVSVVQQMKNN